MSPSSYSTVDTVLEPYEAALILLLGFGVMSVILAFLYNFMREKVFGDSNSLDRAFDAGGNVTFRLTAVNVAVQLLWPADLLQSSTIASKYGISGGFWYSAAVVVNIILFPLLSISFKTRAPGAKTYLQVIKARFGRPAHIVYCVFALLVNLVILSVLLIAGHALLKSLIHDVSDELIFLIFAILFGSFSFIGGLGSTFYVSYANALIVFIVICVYIINLFYLPEDKDLPFGTIEEVYSKVIKLTGPADNEHESYLTFLSLDAVIWAIQGLFVASSVTFCDQASWQSRIAAKPMEGVLGFFLATFLWFAIPATLGTTTSLAYLALSDGNNNTYSLTSDDINAGLLTPYIAQVALGKSGGVIIIVMLTMLMMSAGSGEVIAVASIIVYDIVQPYVYPFKKTHEDGHCVLCGKPEKESYVVTPENSSTNNGPNKNTGNNDLHTARDNLGFNNSGSECDDILSDNVNSVQDAAPHGNLNNLDPLSDLCSCPVIFDCEDCKKDFGEFQASPSSSLYNPTLSPCPVHGLYHRYQDALVSYKSWVILWVTIALVPYGLVLTRTGIDLNWIFMTGSIVTIHSFPALVMAIVWVKTTGVALIIGGIAGLVCGLTACLVRASTLEGGLSSFLLNTSEGYAVLAGAGFSFVVSLVVGVVVSLVTHKIKTPEDEDREWQKLRDIDNPLSPWSYLYSDDFPDVPKNVRPTYQQLSKCFMKAKMTAIIGSVLFILLFVFIIPGVMASLHVLSVHEFRSFLMTLHIWTFLMASVVIVLVPLEEIRMILKQLKLNARLL